MSLGQRRDWFRILRDLTAVGLDYSKIARKCNRHFSTVQKWAAGTEPKESDGRLVLALYARHCPEKYREHQKHFEIRLEADTTPGALA